MTNDKTCNAIAAALSTGTGTYHVLPALADGYSCGLSLLARIDSRLGADGEYVHQYAPIVPCYSAGPTVCTVTDLSGAFWDVWTEVVEYRA